MRLLGSLGLGIFLGGLWIISATSAGCGTPTVLDASPDAGVGDADVALLDAELDAWNCHATGDKWTETPVVCPDADYFITVNGDGSERVFRWNNYWSSDASGPSVYRFPVAQYAPFFACHSVFGSELELDLPRVPPARELLLSSDCNTCYDDGTLRFCSAVAGTTAEITYTRTDPPGGFVAGSYKVVVENYLDGGKRTLWGSFFACRICDDLRVPP